MLESGCFPSAAGRSLPGTTPILSLKWPISNRHMRRLEIGVTPVPSTNVAFLIDPKQPQLKAAFRVLVWLENHVEHRLPGGAIIGGKGRRLPHIAGLLRPGALP